ncbi:expressed unknown protein [Seminavis robusta]|uniref:Uncharacterized protein n=1 Tax=Seminavis robusta TaxID=568900 RepID=A0A9N8HY16_9STRA|nr:expressed unknown protein [Seminavis robusta]|eukprot:Sro1914_g305070.1 n/a (1283) ;mRNA; r:10389-14237
MVKYTKLDVFETITVHEDKLVLNGVTSKRYERASLDLSAKNVLGLERLANKAPAEYSDEDKDAISRAHDEMTGPYNAMTGVGGHKLPGKLLYKNGGITLNEDEDSKQLFTLKHTSKLQVANRELRVIAISRAKAFIYGPHGGFVVNHNYRPGEEKLPNDLRHALQKNFEFSVREFNLLFKTGRYRNLAVPFHNAPEINPAHHGRDNFFLTASSLKDLHAYNRCLSRQNDMSRRVSLEEYKALQCLATIVAADNTLTKDNVEKKWEDLTRDCSKALEFSKEDLFNDSGFRFRTMQPTKDGDGDLQFLALQVGVGFVFKTVLHEKDDRLCKKVELFANDRLHNSYLFNVDDLRVILRGYYVNESLELALLIKNAEHSKIPEHLKPDGLISAGNILSDEELQLLLAGATESALRFTQEEIGVIASVQKLRDESRPEAKTFLEEKRSAGLTLPSWDDFVDGAFRVEEKEAGQEVVSIRRGDVFKKLAPKDGFGSVLTRLIDGDRISRKEMKRRLDGHDYNGRDLDLAIIAPNVVVASPRKRSEAYKAKKKKKKRDKRRISGASAASASTMGSVPDQLDPPPQPLFPQESATLPVVASAPGPQPMVVQRQNSMAGLAAAYGPPVATGGGYPATMPLPGGVVPPRYNVLPCGRQGPQLSPEMLTVQVMANLAAQGQHSALVMQASQERRDKFLAEEETKRRQQAAEIEKERLRVEAERLRVEAERLRVEAEEETKRRTVEAERRRVEVEEETKRRQQAAEHELQRQKLFAETILSLSATQQNNNRSENNNQSQSNSVSRDDRDLNAKLDSISAKLNEGEARRQQDEARRQESTAAVQSQLRGLTQTVTQSMRAPGPRLHDAEITENLAVPGARTNLMGTFNKVAAPGTTATGAPVEAVSSGESGAGVVDTPLRAGGPFTDAGTTTPTPVAGRNDPMAETVAENGERPDSTVGTTQQATSPVVDPPTATVHQIAPGPGAGVADTPLSSNGLIVETVLSPADIGASSATGGLSPSQYQTPIRTQSTDTTALPVEASVQPATTTAPVEAPAATNGEDVVVSGTMGAPEHVSVVSGSSEALAASFDMEAPVGAPVIAASVQPATVAATEEVSLVLPGSSEASAATSFDVAAPAGAPVAVSGTMAAPTSVSGTMAAPEQVSSVVPGSSEASAASVDPPMSRSSDPPGQVAGDVLEDEKKDDDDEAQEDNDENIVLEVRPPEPANWSVEANESLAFVAGKWYLVVEGGNGRKIVPFMRAGRPCHNCRRNLKKEGGKYCGAQGHSTSGEQLQSLL